MSSRNLTLSYELESAARDGARAAQIEEGDMVEDSKPRHECGVFGVFSSQKNASRVTFFALYALNHRAWRGVGGGAAPGRGGGGGDAVGGVRGRGGQ